MPAKGIKQPGDDSLATADTSAEITEKDHKPGERRRAGQDVQEDA